MPPRKRPSAAAASTAKGRRTGTSKAEDLSESQASGAHWSQTHSFEEHWCPQALPSGQMLGAFWSPCTTSSTRPVSTGYGVPLAQAYAFALGLQSLRPRRVERCVFGEGERRAPKKFPKAQRWALFLVSASILVAAHCKVLTGIFECAAVTLLLLLLILQGQCKSADDGSPPISFSHIASQVFGVFYVGYLPSYWIRLRAIAPALPAGAPSGFLVRLLHLIHWPLERSIGCCVCVSCVLCIIASDSCAYFGGKAWGKRPLILVSPRKTFEGAYCGLLGSVVMALLCDQAQHCREVSLCSFSSLALVQMWGFPSDPPMAMLTGALIFSASLLGDLVVSAMKRDARVKDTGSIIPGHGGILDRFDSYFFAAPVAYFCWQAPLFLIDL
eukprot:g15198.t1